MTRRTICLTIASCALPGLILPWLLAREPFQWMLFLLALCALTISLSVCARREALKLAGLALSTLCLGLFAIEGYYALSNYQAANAPASGTAVIPIELARALGTDPSLRPFHEHMRFLPGFGLHPKAQAGKYAFGIMSEPAHQPIFNVVYSTLPDGWRVTPQHPGARKAALFFGCSYTFGWGLNDRDTFPYKSGELLGDGYQVFNFGINGGGAHQFLALLEAGLLDAIAARYDEISVFFLSFSSQPERAFARAVSGTSPPSGPWYELNADDSLTRRGAFPEISFRDGRIYAQLNKSQLFQKCARLYEKMGKKAELALYVALLEKASALLAERYKIPLTVISWPGVKFGGELEKKGLAVLDLAPLFPDYRKDRLKYCVHPLDLHPNALATGIVAGAVVKRIMGKEGN